jgi:hypothetical protein
MIPISLVKEHLNIIDNNSDCYIKQLIESAESALETELNINMCDIPRKHYNIVTMAVCQLVASMYQYREGSSTNETKASYVFEYLKSMIKNYGLNSFG